MLCAVAFPFFACGMPLSNALYKESWCTLRHTIITHTRKEQQKIRWNINKSRKIPRIFPINFVCLSILYSSVFISFLTLARSRSVAVLLFLAWWSCYKHGMQFGLSLCVCVYFVHAICNCILASSSLAIAICSFIAISFGAWSSKNDLFLRSWCCFRFFIFFVCIALCYALRFRVWMHEGKQNQSKIFLQFSVFSLRVFVFIFLYWFSM